MLIRLCDVRRLPERLIDAAVPASACGGFYPERLCGDGIIDSHRASAVACACGTVSEVPLSMDWRRCLLPSAAGFTIHHQGRPTGLPYWGATRA